MGLSPVTSETLYRKWRLFALEYIIDFDAVRAYKECGAYKPKNDNAAQAAVYRLLTNHNFIPILNKALQERTTRLELKADKVILEQLRLAMSDIRNYMSWESEGFPTLKPSAELTEDEARAIAEVKYTTTSTGGTFTFKLHNKQTAIDSVMRHMGLYAADNTVKIELDDELKQARSRLSDALAQTGDRLAHVHSNGHRD